MPPYARYWKNPQHHRDEFNKRHKRLMDLGLHWIDMFSPAAQIRALARRRKYRKAHLIENKLAARLYRKKITNKVGSCGLFGRWKYKMIKDAQNAKLKKLRAVRTGALSRKLVDSKRPANMVFGRKSR